MKKRRETSGPQVAHDQAALTFVRPGRGRFSNEIFYEWWALFSCRNHRGGDLRHPDVCGLFASLKNRVRKLATQRENQ